MIIEDSIRGNDGIGDFDALMRGIKQVRSFVFSENYQIDKATVAASKAAYLFFKETPITISWNY